MEGNGIGAMLGVAGAMAIAVGASGATATVDIYTFDLGQFSDASVTTNVSASHVHSSTFDNPAGFDLFTIGELATAHFGGDEGDRISLGDYSAQDTLTLSYGTNPITVGSGLGSHFVVYEQSGHTTVDAEGQNFEISFDGGTTWIDAHSATSATSVGLPSAPSATRQNQIAFDLTAFGFNVGDQISTVMMRNLIGTNGEFDPDFLFAGLASAIVPLPTGAGMGLAGLTLLAIRRKR